MRYSIFALLFLITACSSNSIDIAQPGSLTKAVRQDLYVKVDNVPSVLGTVVAPFKKDAYTIKIASSTPMDVIFIESCQRQWLVYGQKEEYTFQYKFNGSVEEKLCPIQISTLEKSTQKKEYATIAFEHPDFTLPGTIYCNGKTLLPKGTGLCQGKMDKLQELVLSEPAHVFSKCPMPEGQDTANFKIPLAKGACSYVLSTLSSPHKRMVIFTLGYEADEYAGVKQ